MQRNGGAVLLTSCGGGSSAVTNSDTPLGTYVLTVNITEGNITRTMGLNLMVK